MKPAYGVNVLEINFELNGVKRTIYPTLINDNNSLILVDTGFKDQLSLFRSAIEDAGFDIEKINSIVITHHDRDHIGGLPEFINLLGNKTEVLSHVTEKPYIEGELIFNKKAPRGQTDSRPLTKQTTGVKITRTLNDGDLFPDIGGITVIHTPGHTTGHICLYLKQSKILVTGDALNVVNGNLAGPNPDYTHDSETAFKSLVKLTRSDIRGVISYHGGYFESDINRHLIDLIKENKI